MPSTPIPITPPHQMSNSNPAPKEITSNGSGHLHTPAIGNGTGASPASSISISPQTPFLPAPPLTSPTNAAGGAGGGSILKWAQSFSKSPSNPNAGMLSSNLKPMPGVGVSPSATQQKGFDIPVIVDHDHDHDHDHEHEHDSFEFGDLSLNDMKARTWGRAGRRAVSMSMSMPSSGTGQGGSGIAAMLSGYGAMSPPATATGEINNNSYNGLGVGSPPGGVMADKAAKGQGVLRRLSIGGGGFRPTFISPPLQSPPIGTAPAAAPTIPAPNGTANGNTTASGAPGLQRAATVGSAVQGRGRRFSESGGKKRGVSPMGERILRDHGHF